MIPDKKLNKIHSHFNSADWTITMVKLALLSLVCEGPDCQTSPASVLCSSRRKKSCTSKINYTEPSPCVWPHVRVPAEFHSGFSVSFQPNRTNLWNLWKSQPLLAPSKTKRISIKQTSPIPSMLSTADPGFLRGDANPKGGAPTYFSVKFFLKAARKQRSLVRGRV